MKSNKNGLDEMQRARRDKIGNQSFMLMFSLLMLDAGLYGFGLRWLAYPANVICIITVCMIIYLARVIASDSYLSPKAQGSTPIMRLTPIVVFSIIMAIAAAILSGRLSFLRIVRSPEDNSAIILFIVSFVGLIIALIVTIIKRVNNKDK
ncbi:MAG TPA: hypothetical protein GX721_03875 [Firmicutes bacterium]|nr:hypothetical protein [Bacillota bacterium]